MGGPLVLIGVLTALLGLALLALGYVAVARRRVLAVALSLGGAAILLPSGGLLITLAMGLEGYRELTPGESVARVELERTGPTGFSATVRLPDGRESTVGLSGTALGIEVHVLQVHGLGRLMGLRDAYELAGVVGRAAGDVENAPTPTAFSLAADKPVDAFELARRFVLLAPLLRVTPLSAELGLGEGRAEFDVRLLGDELRVVRVDHPGG
ncbi:MAG: hypothetical protein ACE5PT_15285 [Gemmatimonadales bacterium]